MQIVLRWQMMGLYIMSRKAIQRSSVNNVIIIIVIINEVVRPINYE